MSVLYARVEYPDDGYEIDKLQVKDLDKNKFYAVKSVEMGSSSTSVYLEGTEDKGPFNSVNLEFYVRDEEDENKFLTYNIFADPAYNPYLNGDY